MTFANLPLRLTSLSVPDLRRVRWLRHPLTPILLIAAIARFMWLGHAALWYDESGTAWMATLPWARMVAATAGDMHPPGYLALMWVWVRLFGVSEFAVRLPSLVFSLLAIPLTWRIGLRIGLDRTALIISAALMAVMPSQILYAQEARMYALLQLEVLIALWAVLEFRWMTFGLMLAAMLWTHNYGVVYAVPLNALALVMVVIECKRKNIPVIAKLTMLIGANGFALALWLPWLGVLSGQMREGGARWGGPPLTIGGVVYILHRITWGIAIDLSLRSPAAILLFTLTVYAMGRAVLDADRRALFLTLAVLLPVAIGVVVSVLWKPMLVFRALLPITPMLYLLFGWAFTEGFGLRARQLVVLFAAPMIVVCLATYYPSIATMKGNPDNFIAMLDVGPDDVIYHMNEGSVMSWRFYAPDSWRQYMPPSEMWRNIGALTDATRRAMGFNMARLDDLPWRHAWLINSYGPTVVAAQDVEAARLLAKYPYRIILKEVNDVSGVEIYELFNPAYAK